MNKKISFFIALAIFNFTFASEETTTQDQQIQEEQVLTLKDSNFATRSYLFKATIQAKDVSDTSLFDQKAQELFDMIQTAHRDQNSSNLYNQILVFVKELQEAILAGLNLFTTATTSCPIKIIQTSETAEVPQVDDLAQQKEVTTEASFVTTEEETIVETTTFVTEEETTTEPVTTQAQTEAALGKQIEFSLNVSLEREEDEELFNSITEKMDTLAQMLNANSYEAEVITSLLNDIILAANNLPNTNLTIKIN
jgi:hypothetical protein